MSKVEKIEKGAEKLFETIAGKAPAEAKAVTKAASEESKFVKGIAVVTPEMVKLETKGLMKSAYVVLRTKLFQKAGNLFKKEWTKAAEDVVKSQLLEREAQQLIATDAAKAAQLRQDAKNLMAAATQQLGEDPRNMPKHILGWLRNQSERVGGSGGGPKTAEAWLKQQLELIQIGDRPSIRIPRPARVGATGRSAPESVKKWLSAMQAKASQNPEMPTNIPQDVQDWFQGYLNKPRKPSVLNPPGYDIGHKEALVLSMPGGPDPNRLPNLRWELGTMNRARGSRERALAEKLGLLPK